MPVDGRVTLPSRMIVSTTTFMVSMGMAKPIPADAPDVE
jgi:hypothetical protein